jgi:hypothetical protein
MLVPLVTIAINYSFLQTTEKTAMPKNLSYKHLKVILPTRLCELEIIHNGNKPLYSLITQGSGLADKKYEFIFPKFMLKDWLRLNDTFEDEI